MVHTRINERATNPNPHINFISALLPLGVKYGAAEDEEAKELLRALAAQLKPVMKQHGFTVNSFEEYETNRVFLGRNWNNGETVELVLRDASGRFYPTSRLLGVFCHELAHIKHMNHSSAFHTLRRQLSAEVAELQRKGYYGDGYWSAGTRLSDSQRVSAEGWSAQELPEYTCGGAHSQSRNSALPSRHRRRQRRPTGPSLSTGAQTMNRRKAGSRVTSKIAFEAAGGGSVLDKRVEKGGKGSGFRKKAGSQRAREERAMAAERRLLQMQGKTIPEQSHGESSSESEKDDDDDGTDYERFAPETDKERLKWMQDVMGEDDLGALRDDDDDDILVSHANKAFTDPSGSKGEQRGKGKVSENGGAEASLGQTHTGPSRSPPTTIPLAIPNKNNQIQALESQGNIRRDKRRTEEVDQLEGPSKKQKTTGARSISDMFQTINNSPAPGSSTLDPRNMVDQEIKQRKKEALGMDRPRKLGTSIDKQWACHLCTFANPPDRQTCSMCDEPRRNDLLVSKGEWACSACTFQNTAEAKTCEMCDRQRA